LPAVNSYIKKNSDINILVIFDIPEKYSPKRRWLRDVLTYLDYEMAQKSVWIGKKILPDNFIEDLYEQKINTYIEIFEVSKMGTMER